MTATAAEKRAWANDNGWDLTPKGVIPAEVHRAFDLAHETPAEPVAPEDDDTALAADPPDFTPDPEPAKAPRAGKSSRGSRPAKVTETIRRDMRGKVALILTMPSMAYARHEPEVGSVLVAQVPDISDALTDILAESPDIVAFMTGSNGGMYVKLLALGVALEPVGAAAWGRYIARRYTQGGGPDGWNGETVPPDESRYHAPAF
jgi:hypothetical protein